MASRSVSIDAGNVKLSGRFLPATNGEPRALLVAVHGGTYTSKYFDTSPSLLLEFCASLGVYSILAIDRPGYGAATSIPFGPTLSSMARFQFYDRRLMKFGMTMASNPQGCF